MLKQRTIKSSVQTVGIGLHTGVKVSLTLRPAPVDTGIVFVRSDLPDAPTIQALAHHVTDTRLSSLIEQHQAKVSTVEHLMSALAGLGVDNLYIDITGPEVPIMDGSSGPFIFLIQSVGLMEQVALKKYILIKQVVEVKEGDKLARFEPYPGFKVTYEGQFNHPAFKDMGSSVTVDFAQTSYVQEVARARTFGFTQDVEKLRSMGLALGGSLDNAIVMDEFRVLNADGLRFADEFLRHKILDAIGDLYLIGHPLLGSFIGHKSGHALNNVAARALLDNESAWEFVTFESNRTPPTAFIEPLVDLNTQPVF
ncbi:MAG: UDP-3-O-[3-hydroxymyristoyl] N-acetylglucosamine deacetylase [Ferrovum sp. 37-45-19]|uniref:UDP-3-O-acyl-N-acetylglucosamine deacetylase n=1 Tax=Ferrovum sp. JA12 TaxID=1356299 RepID=UPI000703321B|nr:UDP-3-O-acyl-N-acetylglucosamine deacetylase [Ferrovum sp. JA12]OYV80653.1 MAG: UDP-3-O-[3-hydroxymyristoyl] N-acetylglucosamine deacetylase [Ferrovum sp. 21-44-67]OYV95204.1 MAG: UDP-3-O-[3-hydroxymyristoyl] N-acetylglucosamine deacetylase [Ferrovum sp. 37-45-19]OZB33813.1 MAG: UDP-3-O-[3-hydroxymyristoyl] N-acetylglucosamine deacetylase [Ferrovum sp. 34-44-207]HQT80706.1 UDP-3-O-acyl-N-acetylglucosamine deacetylase [Ferrovaceae bacterium]KRH79799.1 UDP-3-O-[3-hydroxymyristoyl] N-acetylglu